MGVSDDVGGGVSVGVGIRVVAGAVIVDSGMGGCE